MEMTARLGLKDAMSLKALLHGLVEMEMTARLGLKGGTNKASISSGGARRNGDDSPVGIESINSSPFYNRLL